MGASFRVNCHYRSRPAARRSDDLDDNYYRFKLAAGWPDGFDNQLLFKVTAREQDWFGNFRLLLILR